MRRLLLDSNAVDPLVDLYGAFEAAEKAVETGTHELLYTHVNIDELCEVPDLDRRQRLVLLLVGIGKLVFTGAFAIEYSRLNFARVVDDADVFEAVQSGNVDNTRDALLAATALYEQCPLVTNDRRLRKRAIQKGVTVVTNEELLAEFGWTPQ